MLVEVRSYLIGYHRRNGHTLEDSIKQKAICKLSALDHSATLPFPDDSGEIRTHAYKVYYDLNVARLRLEKIAVPIGT